MMVGHRATGTGHRARSAGTRGKGASVVTRYGEVFEAFGYPDVARRLALGEVPLPSPTLDTPFPAQAFPPALVPIWIRVNDQTYLGFWQHVLGDREPTLVTCSAEDGFRVVEFARDAEQAFARTCVSLLSTWGGPTAQIRAFADATGLDLDALDGVSIEVGDDPQQLARFAPFRDDPPLSLVVPGGPPYRGDFPGAGATDWSPWKTCALELPPDVLRAVRDGAADVPEWLSSDDLPATFQDLLHRGELLGAWMALNGPGWSVDQAGSALSELAARAGDDRLSVLARAWTAEPHDGRPGY